jgi:long-chain acyl-CoA synthetase
VREYSIPALAQIADNASMADIVFSRAESQPQAVVMRRRSADGQWRDVTAQAFRDEVAALAKGLIAAGVAPGDRVGLMSATRYEWTLADYAILAAGAVTVPVYETSSAEQVEWILGNSGARAVFAESGPHAELIEGLRDRLAGLGQIWTFDDLEALSAGEAAQAVTDEQVDQRRAARGADDLATIIYTSGTTGQPKGCELTHRNLLADVRNAVAVAPEVFESTAATLLFLPLAHSFARIIQVGCLESGAILGHWPDARTVAKGLPEFQPTFLLAVPRVFEKVYNSAQQQAAASPVKSRIFAAAVDTAIAWSQARPGPAARPVRPAGVRQAAGRGGRPDPVRGVRRRAAGRAPGALLPRRGHHHPGGLRADRDVGRDLGQPARP